MARSRGQARELLDGGAVLVDGRVVKASTRVDAATDIRLTAEPDRWVGRAAYKLLEALTRFGPEGLVVAGRRCLDVGASTGGFTQVLLEAGAAQVTALDVGHGQLAPMVAADVRVVERSGTNIREVRPGDLGEPFAVIVADLSFISLPLVLPAIAGQLQPGGHLVMLVKPQFEVGRERLARTGVVSSPEERRRAVRLVVDAVVDHGLAVHGLAPSPIRGAEGNVEYLLWGRSRPAEPGRAVSPIDGIDRDDLTALVDRVTMPARHRTQTD